MIVTTYCIICGKKQRYKILAKRRLRQHCSQKCIRFVSDLKLKLISSKDRAIKRKAELRIAEWKDRQEQMMKGVR